MAALNKKGCVLTSRRLAYALERLSKHALIDLVVDRVRAEIGEQATDEEVADHVQPWINTVAKHRGDKRNELRFEIGFYDKKNKRGLT